MIKNYYDSMLNLTAILLSKGVLITSSRKLKDQDKIKAGTLEIEVIHTPGHTRGGISLKCQMLSLVVIPFSRLNWSH